MADIKTHPTIGPALVSHWPLDETSGNRVDAHGSNDLVENGSVGNETIGSKTGVHGNAANLVAANEQYLSITDANHTGLDLTGDHFWYALIEVKAVNITQEIHSKTHSSVTQRAWNVEIQSDNKLKWFLSGNGSTGVRIQGTSTDDIITAADIGNFVLLVGSVDVSAGVMTVRKDNVDIAMSYNNAGGLTTIHNSTMPFFLGARNDAGATTFFDGGLDEVGIGTKALTSAEFDFLWDGGNIAEYDESGGVQTAPSAFEVGDWTLTDPVTDGDIAINITSLPDDGNDALTDIRYKVDGGSSVSIGALTTGTYTIPGLTNGTEYEVVIYAVNNQGDGADSDTKSATPTANPDAFEVGDWSVNDPQTGGQLEVIITSLPSINGATAASDIEYQLDSGSWVGFSETTTGTYPVAGLTNDQSYDLKIRLVSTSGNGADSDTKSATPTLAAIPTVTTQAVTDIDTTTATANANVTADNGSPIQSRGIVYGTSPSPNVNDDTSIAVAGTTGAFTAALTGLEPDTLYYVRGHSTNNDGIAYGGEVSFRTNTTPIRPGFVRNNTTGIWERIN